MLLSCACRCDVLPAKAAAKIAYQVERAAAAQAKAQAAAERAAAKAAAAAAKAQAAAEKAAATAKSKATHFRFSVNLFLLGAMVASIC